ncbi:MAG: hypothetical protein M3O55_01680 [Actinomycetota bacterium]|nr:hypothetical protein [Actinomycetota bacterium]
MVRESAIQRDEAGAGGRRWRENMVAREVAASLVGSMLTVRERRAEVRAARLAERERQTEASAAFVRADDAAMRDWLAADLRAADQLLHDRSRHLAVPLVDRLPEQVTGVEADDARVLLEQLSGWWGLPPVALAGATARVVWSPGRVRRGAADIDLLPLGRREHAVSFLTQTGASARPGGDMFDLGGVTVRLGHHRPPSTTMARWRPGSPECAVPVVRPETSAGAVVDRHTLRAVLKVASRDARGRRHPPYREAWRFAVWPQWFGPG